MNEKIEAGRRVAARLLPGEDSLDQAIADNRALAQSIEAAQLTFQLSPARAAGLLGDVHASNEALKMARRNLRRVHTQILRIRADEGLEEEGFGCTRVCLQSEPADRVRLAG